MNLEHQIINTIENAKKFVVKIIVSKRKGFLKKKNIDKVIGTGFFLDNEYIITNTHVIENFDKIKIELLNGEEYNAQIIGSDFYYDISVLKVEMKGKIEALTIFN